MNAHPVINAVSAFAAARGAAPADPLRQSLDQARSSALAYQSIWNESPPDNVDRRDAAFPDRCGRNVALRLYFPQGSGAARPSALYFHGGGYALNSLDTHDRLMRQLAQRSGRVIIGIGYSLAPEVKYPGQLHQALDALAWLRAHAAVWNLDPKRMALAGDSAGAGLALSAALALRDSGLPQVTSLTLFYGMYAADFDTQSHRRFGGGAFGLTTERMRWFWEQYLASPDQAADPYAAPLNADMAGLPPTLVVGAGLDCLLDDSVRLAEKLKLAGIAHSFEIVENMPHSFAQMSALLPESDRAIWRAAEFLAMPHDDADTLT